MYFITFNIAVCFSHPAFCATERSTLLHWVDLFDRLFPGYLDSESGYSSGSSDRLVFVRVHVGIARGAPIGWCLCRVCPMSLCLCECMYVCVYVCVTGQVDFS